MSLRDQGRGKYTLLGLKMAKLLADSLLPETVKLHYQNSTNPLFDTRTCVTQASIEYDRVHFGELLFLALLFRKECRLVQMLHFSSLKLK